MFQKQTVLILDWYKLPEKIRDIIGEKDRFQNDCYLEHYSEFYITDYIKGMSIVEEYWEEQKSDNEYMEEESKTSIDNFIKNYGLELDVWLIEQNIDWNGVEKILIKVCW